ncbi:hypothetical protein CKO42_03855 [Lamprobacter modestohalophilus]|uniref:Uncharacterized protein n=1 Tax=Lamprobacter modestohalophilus TaxID=1064514 RepID=A0A9X0W6A0_9GAMM|nr:hypothetical protein [Lamprobacter modestohalophilus]MBK1617600.1 hypothetical protein [Lamprobacter modestohalophilus]
MTAPTFIVERGPDGCASFVCPQCGKTSRHGVGNGHRASHCSCWPDGYNIETPNGDDGAAAFEAYEKGTLRELRLRAQGFRPTAKKPEGDAA